MSIKRIQFSPIKEQRERRWAEKSSSTGSDNESADSNEDEEKDRHLNNVCGSYETAVAVVGEEEKDDDIDCDADDSGGKDQEDEQDLLLYPSNAALTVKFQITDTQTIAHSYPRTLPLRHMKRDLAAKFRVPETLLQLYHHISGELIADEAVPLNDLPRNNFGIVELKLRSKEAAKLDLSVYYNNFSLPEIITVTVPENSSPSPTTTSPPGHNSHKHSKRIIVEIDNRPIRKPFLGGYCDPKTRIEYHHACTQTGPLKVFPRPIVTRETQTDAFLMRAIRTTRTPRNEIREFVSSDEMLVRLDRLRSVKVLQRSFRAYQWRKLIRESAAQWRLLQERAAKERQSFETANANYNRVLRLLFMGPTEKGDFDQIYAAIQHWKAEEKERLKTLHSDGSYIAELNLVVEREIHLLNEANKLKVALRRAFKEKSGERLLEKLGRPKTFLSERSQRPLQIDTLESQRIRFWTAFYNDLKAPVTAKVKRLELLDSVLKNVKEAEEGENSYAKFKDLQELFERERNLWELNFSSSSMDTLRQRQLLLLFGLIQFLANSRDESQKAEDRKRRRICGKCKKLLPEQQLVLLGRRDVPDICRRCEALHRSTKSVGNRDADVYRGILNSIRREERKWGALASFAFIIQEQDIQYLVESIWHGHSILSQTADRNRLRLPRYIQAEDWAPWNCILLTETEAKTHLRLAENGTTASVYQEHLLQTIQSRNNLARTAFRRLKGIDYEFVEETGQWWDEAEMIRKRDKESN